MKFSIKEDPHYNYFVTSHLGSYRHVFNFRRYTELIISSFDFLRRNDHCFLFAFAVMPTHVHFLIRPKAPHLCRLVVADFHSFTAHQLLKDLKYNAGFSEFTPSPSGAASPPRPARFVKLGGDAKLLREDAGFAPSPSGAETLPITLSGAAELPPISSGAASPPRPARFADIEAPLPKNWHSKILFDFKSSALKFSDRKYNVWESCVVRECYSEWFINMILEYIHNNPVRKGWYLVDDRADYKYSSACFYDLGKEPIIDIENIYDWL